MNGFVAVLRKEILQMLRDRTTLVFALLVPVFELILFGVIDTTVRHVPTAVFDESKTQESRQLVDELLGTSLFELKRYVASRDALRQEIIAGHAQVGIEIPPDLARRRLAGESADFLVLIDGSDNSVASQALSAATGLALSHSLEEAMRKAGLSDPPLLPHPVMLFNPDSRSANLLVPGLVAILLTFSGTILAAFAIVRERERGTLEQLMVTPVSPLGVVVGKLVPYLFLAYVQLGLILFLMTAAFQVPIHGSLTLLLVLSFVYLLALLSLGMLVSSRAKTQAEAIQLAMSVMLPSVLLSGYIFPLSALPGPIRVISQVLPATHYIAITRGIVLRAATFKDLWEHVAALAAISTVLVLASSRAFRKTIR
ncbi:MAG: ABC transporter permease [Thermoanaerobaculia bacterium]